MEKQEFLTNPSLISYLMQNYNYAVMPTLYPEWYNLFQEIKKSEATISELFYLTKSDWLSRTYALISSCQKCLFWALTMPSLAEDERHFLLQSFQYAQQKNTTMAIYLDHKESDFYTSIYSAQGKTQRIKYLNYSTPLHFLVVDNVLLLEEPSLDVFEKKSFYFITDYSEKTLKMLFQKTQFECKKSEIESLTQNLVS